MIRGAGLDGIAPRSGERLRRAAHEAPAGDSAPAADEARFRELARHAPGVLLSLGRGGVILELSAPLCGRSEDFWRGRRLAEAFGPDDGRPIVRALTLLERGASPQELLVPLGTARGEPRLYRFRLAKVAGAGASTRATVLAREAALARTTLLAREAVLPREVVVSGIVTDVTEQVAEERELSEREALLARRHKSAMLAYLAGGVAHDLNNLLTVIVGAAELLGEESDQGDDEDDRRAELTQIQRAGRRASEIMRQLLAFSRREPSVPLIVNLETCIRELAGLLARLLGPGIRLELSFSSAPWLVRIDPLHAEHVITHLALYARQAMPHGGVLWLSLANVHVEGFERRGGIMVGPGEYVELSSRDTGNGMSPGAMERAFEPFFAAEQMPGSTDLTLPLVRNLIVHAFGHIWLESEAGRGTVFHVLFPRYDERRSSAPPPHRPEGHRPEGHRPEGHRPEGHRPEGHRPDSGASAAAPPARSKARRRRGHRHRSRH